MDIERRLEVVEQENDALRERVRQLEAALAGGDALIPFEWGLTQTEARLFGAFLARQLVTKSAAMAALYRNIGRDEAEEKIVDVLVCKIRRKLKPFSVEIQTIWGQGYRLDPEWRARLRSAAEHVEKVAA